MEEQPVHFKKFPTDLYRKAKAEAAIRGITVKDLFIEALKHLFNGRRKNG